MKIPSLISSTLSTRKVFILIVISVLTTLSYGQCPDPLKIDFNQYFCSEEAWMLINEDVDYLSDLQIFPDKVGWSITWYEDDNGAPGATIVNPTTELLISGNIYHVTQTDTFDCESNPTKIIVEERDCACIKDPAFEDQNGNPSGRGIEIKQFSGVDNHKTCGQTMHTAASYAIGTINGVGPNDDAVFVTPGDDPPYTSSLGRILGTVPLKRTNIHNPASSHAFRLNRGVETAAVITAMEKEFIAGEVFVFNFALVLQNPNHDYVEQPFAQVRLYDANDNIVQERCLVSDANDCIFNIQQGELGRKALFSDWSCIKMNTFNYIGEPLRAEFIVAYCKPSQHFTYMYLDDFFVGDDSDEICGDPIFGYAILDEVKALGGECFITQSTQAESSCMPSTAYIPGFPLKVCGSYDAPISQGPPAALDDIKLNIIQNDVVVGTLRNPDFGHTSNTFCFTINASDINVSPYGEFMFELDMDYELDCGSPYNFDIHDRIYINVCPRARCPKMLIVCDISGDGYSEFDLTQQDAMFLGTQWTTDDVELTYYTSEEDAHDNINAIANPESFENDVPHFQTIYIRLDWDVADAPSDCYYLVPLDIEVIKLPIFDDWIDIVTFCSEEEINHPIIGIPDNLSELSIVNYKWYKDGRQLPHSGGIYRASKPGEYTVIVSVKDCEVEKTVTIQEVELSVDLGDPSIDICTEGGAVASYTIVPDVESIGATDIDMDDVTYLWSTGDTTKDLTVTESGTYTLEVSYGDCSYMDTKSILLTTRPELALLEDLVLCKGDVETVVLDITHPDKSALAIDWYRDGGLIAQNVTQLDVSEPGIYKVVTGETLASDCHEDVTFTIEYYNNENCVVPEGLSPNNDGFNDNLDLEFLHDKHGVSSLQVFNRYGLEVYSKDNYINEWYGQSKNDKTLPVGVYFYIIKLKDGSDDITGNIYLNY